MLAALLCGSAANLLSPRRIPWTQAWSSHVEASARAAGIELADVDQVRSILTGGLHFIFDARPVADYDAGHLPSALSLPADEMEERLAEYQALLTPEQPILVYCSGRECDESLLLGAFVRQQGFTNVVLFAGGFAEWSAAGERVE